MDLSIIIPVYNSCETIVECIDSVVQECSKNPYQWELIIVDDGSKDNSVMLIEQYIKSSLYKKNLKLICQKNGGAAIARNTGIRAARGEFIAFNDSDDKWLSGRVELQIEYMKSHPDVVLLAGIYGVDNMSKMRKMEIENIISIKDQVFKFYFSPPCTLLRASILGKTGLFDENMRHAEEGSLFNKIVYNGKSILLLKKMAEPITSKERWGGSGLSGSLWRMEKGEIYNIREAYKSDFIPFYIFVMAISFSLLKYVRRLLLKLYYEIKKSL